MNNNGLNSLLQSRRFLTMLFGIVVTIVLYFASKYFPAGLEDIQFLINTLTPLIIVLIAAFTVSEVAETLTRAQVQMHAANLANMAALAPRPSYADDAALQRPKVGTTRMWHCPFGMSDNPNFVAYTAQDLIEHMVAYHQLAWEKETREWHRKQEMAKEDQQTQGTPQGGSL